MGCERNVYLREGMPGSPSYGEGGDGAGPVWGRSSAGLVEGRERTEALFRGVEGSVLPPLAFLAQADTMGCVQPGRWQEPCWCPVAHGGWT